jgi:hypothetical protein
MHVAMMLTLRLSVALLFVELRVVASCSDADENARADTREQHTTPPQPAHIHGGLASGASGLMSGLTVHTGDDGGFVVKLGEDVWLASSTPTLFTGGHEVCSCELN